MKPLVLKIISTKRETENLNLSSISYDENGNIEYALRKGNVSSSACTIDDLTYEYYGN
ncbi:MAG: hypothetical protein K9J13_06160 [Saprospiraceae bacterium]|nr:hypothetical protein [Saprospiraceae bacterium]